MGASITQTAKALCVYVSSVAERTLDAAIYERKECHKHEERNTGHQQPFRHLQTRRKSGQHPKGDKAEKKQPGKYYEQNEKNHMSISIKPAVQSPS